MPQEERPINLGGVIEGFPTLVPEDYNGVTGQDNSAVSVNDAFNSLGSNVSKGRPSISINNFYTGDRYNSSFPGTDYEELHAQQQSNWDRWGNGIGKMVGTAAGTFISGTAGLIHGLGASVKDGKFSSLYDNSTTQAMDDFSKQLEDTLPNYYTHHEKDADWWTPDNLLTPNFWADKVIKNLGFSAGAIGGGLAWSSMFRATGITNQLVKAGKSLELIEATEKVMTTVPKAQQFGALQTALGSLAQKYIKSPTAAILTSSDRILTSAMGTFGEASLESLQNLNEYRSQLISQYKEKYGYDPKGADLDEINNYADKVGNFTWGMNTLLLTGTNYIMLPKILGSSRKGDKALIGNIGQEFTENGVKFIPKQGYLTRTKALGSLIFSPTEGFEEGAQYAIQTGTKEYFNRAYKNKEDVSDFFSNLSNVLGTVQDRGVDLTLSTKEGLENILIGALSGGLQQARGTIKEQGLLGTGGEKQRNTDLALAALNNTSLVNVLKDNAKYSARAINSQKLRQEAIAENDLLSEKDYELDYTMSYVLPRIKYGKIESLNQEVDYYSQQAISEEGFQELKNEGIVSQNENREQFLARIQNVKNIAKNADQLYSQISDKYSNYVKPNGEKLYNDDVIDRMVYSAAKVADYDVRIPEVSLELLAAGIDLQSTLDDVFDPKSTTKPLRETISQIKALNSINEDDLLDDLRDVIELSTRRKKFVDEYNNIKRNPSSYKDIEPVEAAPVTEFKYTNHKGEVEYLEPNREYTISPREAKVRKVDNEDKWQIVTPIGEAPVFDTKEEADKQAEKINKDLKDTEKVTVLSFNPNGTVEVQDANGDKYNLPLSAFAGYEKSRTDQEKLEKSKEDLDKDISELDKDSGTVGTNDVNVDIPSISPEPKKKKTSELFISTTSQSEDIGVLRPHIVRTNTFLNNAKNLDNYSKLRAILVTPNQEVSLGLSGLSTLSLEGSGFEKSKYTDLNEGLVAAVYVEQDGQDVYFVDEKGQHISKVGETADLNKLVFSTMPTTHLVWSDGKTHRFREGEREQATEQSKRWEAKRKQLFATPQGKYEMYNFSISRGIPTIKDYSERYNVGDNLVPEEKISTQQDLIVIPTTGSITHRGDILKFPNGRPVLQYGDTLQFLSNNNFTRKQARAIFEVIRAMSEDITAQSKAGKKVKINRKYYNFLQNTLYFRKTANTSNNQIFIDTTGMNIYLGGNAYDITKIADNEEVIVSKLQNVFNSINNVTLNKSFDKAFTEYYIDDTDKLATRQWTNYQTYLLSSSYPDGSTRSINDIPLSTSVNPPTPALPYNFKQKYAILEGMELPVISSPKVEIVPTVTEKKAEGDVIDGFTENTYNLKNGPVQFTATEKDGVFEVKVSNNETTAKIAADPTIMNTVVASLKAAEKFDATKENEQLVLDFIALRVAAELQKQVPKKEEIQPAKVEIQGKVPNKEFGKTTPPANSEYRVQGQNDSERISDAEIELFKEWHFKNTPNIPYEILENILIANDGKKAWGAFENNIAKFYKKGLKGTEYHEIFHGVWNGFLSKGEQEALLNEFKSKAGNFTDRASSKKISYDTATDKQAEERIADDFADFREGKLPARSLGEKILRFFKSIIDFVKSFVNQPSKKEELFKAIDSGEFKDVKLTPSENPIAQYRQIPGLTEEQSNEFVQDITARFFQNVFGTNSSLYSPELLTSPVIFSSIKDYYVETGRINNSDPEVLSDSQFDQLVTRTKQYLKTFKIEFDEDNVLTINNEEQNRIDYAPEPFSTNWKKSSPFPVKLLLATLTETVPQNQENDLLLNLPSPKISSVNGYRLLNFSRAFATVLDKLANTTKITNMVDKLISLAKFDSNYVRLFTRLKGDRNNLVVDFSKFESEDWRLFVNFYQTFTKQKPNAYIQYINDGEVYSSSANLATPVRAEQRAWIENMRGLAKLKDSLISYDKSSKTYKVGDISKIAIKTPQDQVKFLAQIGVQFPMEAYNKLKTQQRKRFSDAVAAIHKYFGSEKDIMSITGKTLGINGQLTTLAELFVIVSNPNQEVSYFGIEGKRRQAFTDNNALSVFENDFNSSETLSDLLENRPELNDIFSSNSQILKPGGVFFDISGKRIKSLKVAYIQGTNNIDGGRETTTSKLSLGDRYVQEINQNVNGKYYILVPADSSTEWMMELGNQVNFEDFETGEASDKITSIFKGYLKDDIALAKENRNYLKNTAPRAKELRFFKDILSEKTLSQVNELIKNEASSEEIDNFINANIEDINTSILKYISEDVDSTITTLSSNNQLLELTTDTFTFPNLDDNFAQRENLSKYSLSGEEVKNIISFTNANYIINNIELHKTIFGDPYQFAIKNGQLDETKRIKSFLSPRRTTFDSPEFNTYLNQQFNKVGDILLTPEDPGYHLHKSYVDTVTLEDVTIHGNIASLKGIPEEIKKPYAKTNEADAFSIIMDGTYREVKLKNGQWSKEAEDWHQWQMAYTRQNIPGYEYLNKELEKSDIKLLSTPQPNFKLEILKPIVSGARENVNTINLVLDKMSQMPLYYSSVEGTNLEKLYIKMWKEQKGYVVFESGRKVGAEKLESLYTPDGKFNNEPFNNIIPVSWKSYGIQVENSYDKPKQQTRGSQITKLSSLDFFDNGVAISESAKKEFERNKELLNKMHNNGYKNLLNDLGIEDLNGVFRLVDNVSVSQVLQRELLTREASENIKDVLQLDENGAFRIPFEASSSYIQIKDILYSMVDKAIISPKMSGGAHVQVPSTLWENAKEGRKVVEINGKKVFTSSTLKFYTKEDPYCEILLPAWFKDKINPKRFKTDAEILNYLNRSQEGKDILKGIGFRIPTQSMSSIEIFRVKGFLPEYMGSTVVVPSEITTKAGSDFDIDKLNMYLKSIYTDEKGDIKLVKYKGSEEETKEFYGKLFDRKLEKQKLNRNELLEALQTLHYGLEDTKGLIDKYADILNTIVEQSDDLSVKEDELIQKIEQLGNDELQSGFREKFVKEMYKSALENEYYNSLEKLITIPENFERLISPVDDAGLKQVSVELDKLNNQDETGIKNRILSRNYMTSTRHAFVTGKKWVGVAAVNITGHSLTQKSDIYIDPDRFVLVSNYDQKFLDDGEIVLPHNKNAQGYISISGVKTADGKEYISSRLSGYATSFVDVAKDPYILKIIKSDLALGTFMFLERIGAGENIAYFMNQPIISNYLSYLDSINARGLFRKDNIDTIKDAFLTTDSALLGAKIDVSSLKSTISKFAEKGELTESENAVQHKILDEFLKYAKMAEYSFKLTQASNYDTATFRSQDSFFKKQVRTEQARNTNIFSSVDKMLDGSFIGEQSFILSYAYEATGEILKLDKYEFRENVINPVLRPFAKNEYLSADKYDVIANKIVTAFIDYSVQTKSSINDEIRKLLVDVSTSVVGRLAEAKKNYPQLRILKDLEARTSDKPYEVSTKSITLKANIKDAYDENLYTEMMRELRDFPATNQLYKDIVKLSILQGTYQSSISIGNIVPLEDRSALISPIIQTLSAEGQYNAYSDGAFQRNNWKNPDIVRKVNPKFFTVQDVPIGQDVFGQDMYQYMSPSFPNIQNLGIKATDRKILLLNEKYNAADVAYDFVIVPKVVVDNKTGERVNMENGKTVTNATFVQRKLKGDYSLQDVYGYKKVKYFNGLPVTIVDNKGNNLYIYKLINLWGDGMYASEYYTENKPSVLNNGTVKITQEIPDTDIISYYGKQIEKSTPPPIKPSKEEGSSDIPECS